MASQRLDVILNLVTDKLRSGSRAASDSMRGMGNAAKQAANPIKLLGTRLGDLSTSQAIIADGMRRLAFEGLRQFRQFVVGSIKAASDLVESTNAIEKVFGTAAGQIIEFGKVSAQAVGLSNREFRELSTEIGALFQNFGMSADEAARETIKLTLRAADMASIFNTDVKQALDAIGSALRQETRPIRQFGVTLSDAEIRARAVADGLADTTAEVSRNDKAMTALKLIYEQTDKTQGDFVATSDELANALRIQQAELENAQAAFGQALIPALVAASEGATDLVLSLQSIGEGLDKFGEKSNFTALDVLADLNDANIGSFVVSLFTMKGATAGAAGEALRMREALEALSDNLESGASIMDAFETSVFHLGQSGILTSEMVLALAAAAGVTEDRFPGAANQVAAFGRAAGLTEEQIQVMIDAILGASSAVHEVTNAADIVLLGKIGPTAVEAADGIEEIGDEADTAADHLEEMKDNFNNLRQAFLNAANPVRQAADAIAAIGEAETEFADLEKAGASAEELASAWLDINLAKADAQLAMDVLNLSYDDAMRLLLATSDMTKSEIEEQLALLDIFPNKVIVDVELRTNITSVINALNSIGSLEGFLNLQPTAPNSPNPNVDNIPIGTGVSNAFSSNVSSSTVIQFNGDVVSDDIVGDVQTSLTVASIANRMS